MSASDSETEFSALSISADLVEPAAIKPAGTTSIAFPGLLTPPLTLHEDLSEGCGGQLWPAGMVLAKHMLRRREHEVVGRSIVELGAGGGLVGLAVALAFPLATPVLITDQAALLALMNHNISLNGLSSRVQACVYSWGEPPPPEVVTVCKRRGEGEAGQEHPDIILAADCVYFEPAFPLLLRTLSDLVGPDTVCYFCFKKRRRADLHFVKALKKTFDVVEVQDDPDREVYSRENLFLFKIRRRRRSA